MLDINKTEKMNLVRAIIESIGDNPNREGLKETPDRVARSWSEMFYGYDDTKKPKVTVFSNHDDGIDYDEVITDSGPFNSFCEHHMLPFRGMYHFAYRPRDKVLGLSKVARIVDYFSARLQVQERLTKQIVDEIETILEPNAIALVLQASHECKELRGVKKPGLMTTSVMRGEFRSDPAMRNEFLQFIINKNQ